MSLRDQLQTIYDERGKLTPALVVDTARKKTHPLHEHFEWDDKVAGEAHRRSQAASLIRSVRIVYDETPKGDEKSVRAFVSVQRKDEPDKAYLPTSEVLDDPFLRQVLLRECERDIATLKRKYGHLKEFADLLAKAAA